MTVIVLVMGFEHCPPAGVKVYVPVAVLLTVAGLHVPVTPFVEVVGNMGAVVPAQNGGMAGNVGTNIGSERITPVNKDVEHPLISTVKLE